jgi:hypothetical protein
MWISNNSVILYLHGSEILLTTKLKELQMSNAKMTSDARVVLNTSIVTAAFLAVMVAVIFVIAAVAQPAHAASVSPAADTKSEVIAYEAEITCAWL